MSGHTPAEVKREASGASEPGHEAIALLIEYDDARHRFESGLGGLQAELDLGAAHAHICIFLQRRGLA